jgi:hypothetical protein
MHISNYKGKTENRYSFPVSTNQKARTSINPTRSNLWRAFLNMLLSNKQEQKEEDTEQTSFTHYKRIIFLEKL